MSSHSRYLVLGLALSMTAACTAKGGVGGPGPADPDGSTQDDVVVPPGQDVVIPPGQDVVVPPGQDVVVPPGPDVVVPPGPDVVVPPVDVPVGPSCGNGTCGSGETCTNCPADCGACVPRCGDGMCTSGETCTTCASDCGACVPRCGDGTCTSGETCTTCASDCGTCPSMGGMNYRRTETTATFVDACLLPGVQRVLVGQDDADETVTLPFAMTLFGIPTPMGTPLHVSPNGFVSLRPLPTPLAELTIYGTIPNTAAPNALIAAYWSDIVLGADGVCAATMGTAPSRRFILQWKNGQFYGGMGNVGMVNFELVYNEGDQSIDFLYQTVTGLPLGTPHIVPAVGAENFTGTGGLAVCGGGRSDGMPAPAECTAVTSGTRFRFVPAP